MSSHSIYNLIKENQKEQLYSKLDANLKLALKTNLSN